MASVVDTSVKFFHSKMLGAPVWKGQVGNFILTADACLVNGWGSQTASSVVVSSGVCTMTFPLDHAAIVECVVLVAGSSISDLNGEQKVTITAPNVIKFATAAANGTATGTITAKMAPAGFAKPFSGTNLAVYKSLDVAANGHFCRVNDASAMYARAIAYENMTAISTGTGLAPTTAQLSGGQYWFKSGVANAAPIDWYCVSDGRMFYFGCASYQSNDILGNAGPYAANLSGPFFGFGDPIPFSRAGDPFSTSILGCGESSNAYSGFAGLKPGYGTNICPYMMRSSSGTGTAVVMDCISTSGNQTADPVFDLVTGQVIVSKVIGRTTTTTSNRVELPGVHTGESITMEKAFINLSTFKSGTPARTYLAVLSNESTGSTGNFKLLALDVTGPWR